MGEKVSVISVAAKKDFIRRMLQRYKMKRKETVWVLNYLLCHDEILSNVKFVDDIDTVNEKNKRALISATCSEKEPFIFIKDETLTNEVEKFYHDIRINPTKEIYIQIAYKDINTCPIYASVNETHNNDQGLSSEVLKEAAQIIIEIEQKMILNEIDKALDKSDHNAFMELWVMLNNLKEAEIVNAI